LIKPIEYIAEAEINSSDMIVATIKSGNWLANRQTLNS